MSLDFTKPVMTADLTLGSLKLRECKKAEVGSVLFTCFIVVTK